jgi:hypothetical protein
MASVCLPPPFDAAALCSLTSRFAGIALIQIRKRQPPAGRFLSRMGQLLDLRAILLMGRCHLPRRQPTRSINRQMHFRTLAACEPDSGVDCNVRLSRIMAPGCALPSSHALDSSRRPCTIASKQPARLQRCVG